MPTPVGGNPPEEGGLRVFLLDLSGPPSDDDALLLDDAEIARARRYLRDVDLDRFVLRRALTRLLLAADLGCRPGEIVFELGPCGRPRVLRPLTDRAFSLSSSERLGLLAVGTDPLGVDVEHVRTDRVSAGAAAHFLTAREMARWDATTGDERVQAFFVAWTRKEAVAKAHGLGLGGMAPRRRELAFTDVPGLTTFTPVAGYVAALASGVDIAAGSDEQAAMGDPTVVSGPAVPGETARGSATG